MTEEIWIGENDIRRKLEGEELKDFLAVRAKIKQMKDEAEAVEAQRQIDKAALLDRLGITDEEAKLLLA